MGILDHLTCLLRNLYAGQEATVRTRHGITYCFQIEKGVCQGCILLPCLFNFYAEYIMRNAGLEEAQAGIKIAGKNINNLRYADDTYTYLPYNCLSFPSDHFSSCREERVSLIAQELRRFCILTQHDHQLRLWRVGCPWWGSRWEGPASWVWALCTTSEQLPLWTEGGLWICRLDLRCGFIQPS